MLTMEALLRKRERKVPLLLVDSEWAAVIQPIYVLKLLSEK